MIQRVCSVILLVPCILIFCVLSFRSELQDFVTRGVLTHLFLSYSRDEDQTSDAPRYVQDNLKLKETLVMHLLFNEGAIVFICG